MPTNRVGSNNPEGLPNRASNVIPAADFSNNALACSVPRSVRMPEMFKLSALIAALAVSALACAQILPAAPAPPILFYSSAKAGPGHGWEGQPARGAAISIWGKSLGRTRGSNFVSVAGVPLASDSDYAEWGATRNPTTAKGFQRITFWLNSSMPAGDTSGITVTVDGVTSNSLPFTIDNTGVIRFVDGVNGNDSWDGKYKDHTLGHSHGPWKTPFLYNQRAGAGPGTFFYLRKGIYSTVFEASSGHPALAYIGYFEQGSTNCNVYYPQINGTDARRYTVTSYPGELAVFQSVRVSNKSSYWTFTNFRWNDTSDAYGMGDEWSMCSRCQLRSTGLDVIGMQFDGPMHHAIHSFGDNFRILANYIDVVPVGEPGGYDETTAYPLYLSSGNDLLVKDNEIHGGAMYSIHHYDEPRCSGQELNRAMNNSTFDSNLLDLTRNSVSPVNIRAGILTGINIPGNSYNNTTIRNNIIYSRDNLVSEAAIKLFSETPTTLNGVHIYNNTVHRVPWGLEVIYSTAAHYQNVELVNNIFDEIGRAEIYVDGGDSVDIKPTFHHNLVNQTPRVTGRAIVGANVFAPPLFVDAPADFHLQSSSPAIRGGEALSSVTEDYDGTCRPEAGTYDIGALEFVSGATTPASDTATDEPQVRRKARKPWLPVPRPVDGAPKF
jgi:hypothetical protein